MTDIQVVRALIEKARVYSPPRPFNEAQYVRRLRQLRLRQYKLQTQDLPSRFTRGGEREIVLGPGNYGHAGRPGMRGGSSPKIQ